MRIIAILLVAFEEITVEHQAAVPLALEETIEAPHGSLLAVALLIVLRIDALAALLDIHGEILLNNPQL